ncbi:3-isopropylmalate dehydratase small subunit [Advenella mimigardefordensis]|uniref:3-isopropylmalate dehydratase n=1 Tax=Advenella mimigardefordensis (strain DSM 17166 / LMG 22922 / DPN7) TaxID=1247726 RepID=W0PAU0_ADVMD|nr:3-isopropylmalate dehydratase small subunit [Advenella mimigardefordensis]AHG62535.1 3-isopropylmalate dehydratase small subunit [Advenella mimigardefordensis DPN7]
MEKIRIIDGRVASLRRENVDTDTIIRIERLSTVEKSQLGQYAFEALRYDKNNELDPSFPYNQPMFAHAPILTAGANFGCGSSREGAVWSLVSLGVRCVIAPSFGEIFHNNCFQNGVLPIVLPASDVALIDARTSQGDSLTVNLQTQQIRLPDGRIIEFDIDARRRDALLEGRDDIAQTLTQDAEICAWQAQDREARPWVWLQKQKD